MNKLYKLTCYLSAIMLTCCTAEVQHEGNGPLPGADDDDALKREVVLTLKNKLAISQAGTKTGGTETKAIATAEENYIRSLDVYVFGSETEDGEYTFQELFYYRDDASLLTKSWAKPINLTAAGDNTTALLKLSKGLFVKLYCVANYDRPSIPEGGRDGGAIGLFSALVPLTQSAPGEPENIVTPGQPTETVFLTSMTGPIMRSSTPPTTPLAMAGSYTTPLDLTDFDNSARTQMSFKLTRLNARFDVVNDAAQSKFTIKSIAMGNARIGATFFPIRPLDEAITGADYELQTTTARPFDGNQANTGLQPGAFYCYPSPKEDGGYLILKGTYAVNQTQSQEVTYQIPFKPSNADEGSFLEVAYNHRYTIAITDADPYHLDFTLTVADWADDGSIDEYTPGDEVDASIKVDVATDPNGSVSYDETAATVTMPVSATNTFNLSASQGLSLTKSYMGTPDDQQYDWLVVSEPVATKAATESNYTYTFSVKENYTGGKYPVALLRLKNIATGKSQLLRVAPVTPPTVTTGSSYTITGGEDAQIYVDITVDCALESSIGNLPGWLVPDKTEAAAGTATYRVSLDITQPDYPTSTPAPQTITFCNKQYPELTTDVTVSFIDKVWCHSKITNVLEEVIVDDSYRVGASGKTGLGIVAYSLFKDNAPTLSAAYDADFGEGNSWLSGVPENPTKYEITTTSQNKYIYLFDIPESTGADRVYQLHKGTLTLRDTEGNPMKKFTLWRGESTVPYPTKGYDGNIGGSPYYTAIEMERDGVKVWFAPINLGANQVANTKAADRKYIGNLYQWGRKVPTYYNDDRGITPGPVTDINATEPFIDNNNLSPYDWLTPANDNLWSDGGAKGINDPCPEGWRVPTSAQLELLTGRRATDMGFYVYIGGSNIKVDVPMPKGGYRNSAGTSVKQKDNGYFWSATPNTPGGLILGLTVTDDPKLSQKTGRACALTVRCVKDDVK